MRSIESLRDRFERLAPREQTVLLTGAVIAAVLLIYLLLVQPASALRDRAQAELDGATRSLQARIEAGTQSGATAGSCDETMPTLLDADAAELLNRLALRPGLATRVAEGNRLALDATDGSTVLHLVDALGCAGIPVLALELERVTDGSGFRAEIALPDGIYPSNEGGR